MAPEHPGGQAQNMGKTFRRYVRTLERELQRYRGRVGAKRGPHGKDWSG